VRCFAPEHDAAQSGSFRYRRHQFKDARFELIPKDFQGDHWMGFAGVRPFGPDLAIIPLAGHTRGHTVVAVRDDEGWMLHCGDAYYHRSQLDGGKIPWALKIFQRLNDEDAALAAKNRARLADFRRTKGGDVRVFSAHDPTEYREFA
jgi:glyoxylase-like metal-dependent hydrolase (beta-lactamase superfamily II)